MATTKSTTAKKKPVAVTSQKAPTRMDKYKRAKDLVKYYKLKQKVLPNLFTAGDAAKLTRFERSYAKLRKQVASELMRANLAKRAARGKGKRRGSDLMRLQSK